MVIFLVFVKGERPQPTAYPHCATLTRAVLPPGVPSGSLGPCAIAMIGLLHGRYHRSDRETVQALHDLFGLPLSLGMITRVEATLTTALDAGDAEVLQAVQDADRAWVDEASWKQGRPESPGNGTAGCGQPSRHTPRGL